VCSKNYSKKYNFISHFETNANCATVVEKQNFTQYQSLTKHLENYNKRKLVQNYSGTQVKKAISEYPDTILGI